MVRARVSIHITASSKKDNRRQGIYNSIDTVKTMNTYSSKRPPIHRITRDSSQ